MKTHPSNRSAPRFVAILFGTVTGATPLYADVVTWTGLSPQGPDWDLAANWSPGLPQPTSDVELGVANTTFQKNTVPISSFTGTGQLVIVGGTLLPAAPSSIGSLSISGGVLGGAAPVVDASGTIEAVHAAVMRAVRDRLGL